MFGRTASEPFTPSHIRKRARDAWAAAGLTPIGLHECRHTYVSLMHAAGLTLERIGDYVGHSSAFMVDHYRRLLDGHEDEAADALDAYLARATGASTSAQAASEGRSPYDQAESGPGGAWLPKPGVAGSSPVVRSGSGSP